MKRNKVDSIGCGNGRSIGLGRNLICSGLISSGLISIAIGWVILNLNSD